MTNPAQGYEDFMVPVLFAPWAQTLVDLAAPAPGERVLDLGCGTGIVARTLAARGIEGLEISALDPSPEMLAVARSAGGEAITWHEGRAEALPYDDASFEAVLSQFALMFFGDRASALTETRRVLAPGGRALFAVWQGLDEHPFYRALHEVIERRIGISALADIFCLGDALALAQLGQTAGFRDVMVRPHAITARFPDATAFIAGEIEVDTAAIPSMQALDAQARAEIVEAISADIAPALAAVTQDGAVVMEFHAHLLTLAR